MRQDQCTQMTNKLNCGCCEEIRLTCEKIEGHSGAHQGKIKDNDDIEYHVRWFKNHNDQSVF